MTALENARERVRLLLAATEDDPDIEPARRAIIQAGELRVAQAVVAHLENAAR